MINERNENIGIGKYAQRNTHQQTQHIESELHYCHDNPFLRVSLLYNKLLQYAKHFYRSIPK